MSINIQVLLKQAVEHTLELAERQVDKGRSISNLNAEPISHELVEKILIDYSKSETRHVDFITAIIESDDGYDESLELDEIVRLLKEGFSSGFNSNESGSFMFEVQTLRRG